MITKCVATVNPDMWKSEIESSEILYIKKKTPCIKLLL